MDSTDPKLSNISITPSNTTVAYKKTEGTNDNYYVDNSNGVTFTFAGVTTDNIGVDNVKLEIKKPKITNGQLELDEHNAVVYENHGTSQTVNVSEWSFANVNLTGLTGTSAAPTKVIITVTDVAGNTKEEVRRLVFDTSAPKAMHWADAKYKDVYFRIGNANNDRKSTDTTSAD